MAIRFFELIEREFHRRLPLSTLFEHPTIEGLGRLLAAGDSSSSCVVSLGPALGKPSVLTAGLVGELVISAHLARHLAEDFAVFGLEPRDGAGDHPLTVEGLARRYVEDLRSVQPRGPYRLGGFCAGGTIAFKVAQQLPCRCSGRSHAASADGRRSRPASSPWPSSAGRTRRF